MNISQSYQDYTYTRWINNLLLKNGKAPVESVLEDFLSCNLVRLFLPSFDDFPSANSSQLDLLNYYQTLLTKVDSEFKKTCKDFRDITATGLAENNKNELLRLIWLLIVHQSWSEVQQLMNQEAELGVTIPLINKPTTNLEDEVKSFLLNWMKDITEKYSNVHVTNLHSSLRDGTALLAVLHSYNMELIDYENQLNKTIQQNVTLALHLAEKYFQVPCLINPEMILSNAIDIANDEHCQRCLLLYVMQLYIRLTHWYIKQQSDAETRSNSPPPSESCDASVNSFVNSNKSQPSSKNPLMSDNKVRNTLNWFDSVEQDLDVLKSRLNHYMKQFHSSADDQSILSVSSRYLAMDSIEETSSQIVVEMLEGSRQYLLPADVTVNKQRNELETITGIVRRISDQSVSIQRLNKKQEHILNCIIKKQENFSEILTFCNEKELNLSILDEESLSKYLARRWDELCEDHQEVSTRIASHVDHVHSLQFQCLCSFITVLQECRQSNESVGPELEQIKAQIISNERMHSLMEIGSLIEKDLIEFLNSLKTTTENVIENEEEEEENDKDSNAKDIQQVQQNIRDCLQIWTDLKDSTNHRFTILQNALLQWRSFCEEESLLRDWLMTQLVHQHENAHELWDKMFSRLWNHVDPLIESCENNIGTKEAINGYLKTLKELWSDVANEKNWQKECNTPRIVLPDPIDTNNVFSTPQSPNDHLIIDNPPPPLTPLSHRGEHDQSPYRLEFEQSLNQALTWLEMAEECLELLPDMVDIVGIDDGEVDLLPIECQSEMYLGNLYHILQEMPKWQENTLVHVRQLGEQYCAEVEDDPESLEEARQLLDEIELRWEAIETLRNSRHDLFQCGWLKTMKFHALLVEGKLRIDEWLKWNHDVIEPHLRDHDPDQHAEMLTCISSIRTYHTDFAMRLENELQLLLVDNSLGDEMKDIVKQRYEDAMLKWSDLKEMFDQQCVQLIQYFLKAHSIFSACETFLWLDSVGNFLKASLSSDKLIHDPVTLSDQRDQAENFLSEVEKHENILNEFPNEEFGVDAPVDLINEIQQFAKTRFLMMKKELESHHVTLQQTDSMLSTLLSRLDELDKWVQAMLEYFESIDIARLDRIDLMRKQLTETEGAFKDMMTLTPILTEVDSQILTLEPHFHPNYAKTMKQQLQQMCDSWRKVKSLIQSHSQQLHAKILAVNCGMSPDDFLMFDDDILLTTTATSLSNSLGGGVGAAGGGGGGASVETDPTSLSRLSNYSNEELVNVSCESVLFKMVSSWLDCQEHFLDADFIIENDEHLTIRERCLTSLLDEMEEKRASLLEVKECEEQKQLLIQLENLENRLKTEEERLNFAKIKWNEFLENNKQLQEFNEDQVDAEQMSLFQTLLSSMNTIQDQLVSQHMFQTATHKEVNEMKEKWNRVNEKFNELMKMKSFERSIEDKLIWIQKAKKSLQNREAADLVGEEVPEEFRQLGQGIAACKTILNEINQLDLEKMSKNLNEKRINLQDGLAEIERLYLKFARPADFDPCLARVQGELQYIADHICMLDLVSLDPRDVLNTMEHANRFADTLENLQKDLDYVIRTGRDLVEINYVEHPDRLLAQLTNLEEKHFALSNQVNRGLHSLKRVQPLLDEVDNIVKDLVKISRLGNHIVFYLNYVKSLDTQVIIIQKSLQVFSSAVDQCTLVKDILSHVEPLMADSDIVRALMSDVFISVKNVEDQHKMLLQKQVNVEAQNQILNEQLIQINQQLDEMNELLLQQSNTMETKSLLVKQMNSVKEFIDNLTAISNQQHERIANRLLEINEKIVTKMSLDFKDIQQETASQENILEESLKDEMRIFHDSVLLFSCSLRPLDTRLLDGLGSSELGGLTVNQNNQENSLQLNYNDYGGHNEEKIKANDEENERYAGGSEDEEDDNGTQAVLISVETLKEQIQHFIGFEAAVFSDQREYFTCRVGEMKADSELRLMWQDMEEELNKNQEGILQLHKVLNEYEREKSSIKKYFDDSGLKKALILLDRIRHMGFNLQEEEDELHKMAQADHETHILNRLEETQWSAMKLEDAIRSMTEENIRDGNNDVGQLALKNGGTGGGGVQVESDAASMERRFRERLRILCQQLNGIQEEIHKSFQGDIRNWTSRIKHVECELKTCTDIILGLNFHIQNVQNTLKSEIIFHFCILLDVQKRRHLVYSRALMLNHCHWVLQARRWDRMIKNFELENKNLQEIKNLLNNSMEKKETIEEKCSTVHKSLTSMEENIVELMQCGCLECDVNFLRDKHCDLVNQLKLLQTQLQDSVAPAPAPPAPSLDRPLSMHSTTSTSIFSDVSRTSSTKLNGGASSGNRSVQDDNSSSQSLSSSSSIDSGNLIPQQQATNSFTDWLESKKQTLTEWQRTDVVASLVKVDQYLTMLRELEKTVKQRYRVMNSLNQAGDQQLYANLLLKIAHLELTWTNAQRMWKDWQTTMSGLHIWICSIRDQWNRLDRDDFEKKKTIKLSIEKCASEPFGVLRRAESAYRALMQTSHESSANNNTPAAAAAALPRAFSPDIESEMRSMHEEWHSLENLVRGDKQLTSSTEGIFDKTSNNLLINNTKGGGGGGGVCVSGVNSVAFFPNIDSRESSSSTARKVGYISKNSFGSTTTTTAAAQQLHQGLINRFLDNWQQLYSWLQLVNAFLNDNVVTLGDRFEEETMLLRTKLTDNISCYRQHPSFPSIHMHDSVYSRSPSPVSLPLNSMLLYVQHYMEERKTKEAQLERISLESERIEAHDNDSFAEVKFKVEEIHKLWNSVTDRLIKRASELKTMSQWSADWDLYHSELDKWLRRYELEWENNAATENIFNGNNHHRKQNQQQQHSLTSLAEGEIKWNKFCKHSEELLHEYENEDVSRIKLALDQMTLRWNSFLARQRERGGDQNVDGQQQQHQSQSQSVSPGGSSQYYAAKDKLTGIENSLNQLNKDFTIKTTSDNNLPDVLNKRLEEIASDLQSLRTELAEVSRGNSDVITPTEAQMLSLSWTQLKDRLKDLKSKLERGSDDYQVFLAQLQDLNDCFTQRDSELRQLLQEPFAGDLMSLMKQYQTSQQLVLSLNKHRGEVENALDYGNTFHSHETHTDNQIVNLLPDSGSESDCLSSMDAIANGSSKSTDTYSLDKRLYRRIRRQLHLLKKNWLDISLRTKDFNEKVTLHFEKVKGIDTGMKDMESRLKLLELEVRDWLPMDRLSLDMYEAAFQQAETAFQNCQAIQASSDSIQNQLSYLIVNDTILCHSITPKMDELKSRFHQVRNLVQERLKLLMESIRSMQQSGNSNMEQQQQQQQQQQPHHMVMDNSTILHHIPSLPPAPPLPPVSQSNIISNGSHDPLHFLQASVPASWQRSLHHSGNYVPYYKNIITQETQWDHPTFMDIMESVQRMNQIRFCAYRCGMKLRILQRELSMDLINLIILEEAFQQVNISQSTSHDQLMDLLQISFCLKHIYTELLSAKDNSHANSSTLGGGSGGGGDEAAAGGNNNSNSQRPSRSRIRDNVVDSGDDERSKKNAFGCGAVFRSSSRRRKDRSKTPARHEENEEKSLRQLSRSNSDQDLQQSSSSSSMPRSKQQWFYKISNHLLQRRISVALSVDLVINWMLNVFDTSRTGKIQVFAFKVALVLLCGSPLDEKYRYLYSLICDNDGNCAQRQLAHLLQVSLQLPTQLGESAFFGGTNVEPSVRHCFQKASGEVRPFLRLNHFLSWLRQEPQALVWLPVLHRLIASENAVHSVRCSVCHTSPIHGLRYRCLRCLKYDLCQTCFFTGKHTRAHKLAHPMQEYCSSMTSGENLRDYSRIVRNRFKSGDQFKRSHEKLGTVPVMSMEETLMNSPNSPTRQQQQLIPLTASGTPGILPPQSSMAPTSYGQGTPSMSRVTRPAVVPSSGGGSVNVHMRMGEYAQQLALWEKHKGNAAAMMQNPARPGLGTPALMRPTNALTTSSSLPLDEEHQYIAQMTQELRRQSNPDMAQSQLSAAAIYGHLRPLPQMNMTGSSYTSPPAGSHTYAHPTAAVAGGLINSEINSGDLSRMIHGLEIENRQLLSEYERLRAQNLASRSLTPIRQVQQQHQQQQQQQQSFLRGTAAGGGHLTPSYGHPSGTMTLGRTSTLSPGVRLMQYGPAMHEVAAVEDPKGMLSPALFYDVHTHAHGQLRIGSSHQTLLESRMMQLEEHNSQLEAQLTRLKQYVLHSSTTPGLPPMGMTLGGTTGGGGGGGLSVGATPLHQGIPLFTPATHRLASSQLSTASDVELYTAQQYIQSRRLQQLPPPSNSAIAASSFSYNAPRYLLPGPAGSLTGVLPRHTITHRGLGGSNHELPHPSYTSGVVGGGVGGGVSITEAMNYNSKRGYAVPTYPERERPPEYPAWRYKAASETGGSLGERDFDNLIIAGHRASVASTARDWPIETVSSIASHPQGGGGGGAGGGGGGSIGSLFHMAGQVGRAMGQLVDVMTDDFTTTAGGSTMQQQQSSQPNDNNSSAGKYPTNGSSDLSPPVAVSSST